MSLASVGSFVFSVRFVFACYAAGFLLVAVMLFGMALRSVLDSRRSSRSVLKGKS